MQERTRLTSIRINGDLLQFVLKTPAWFWAAAVKTGCALVPGHTTIGPDGRYRAVYDPPLEWTPSDGSIRAIQRRSETSDVDVINNAGRVVPS